MFFVSPFPVVKGIKGGLIYFANNLSKLIPLKN